MIHTIRAERRGADMGLDQESCPDCFQPGNVFKMSDGKCSGCAGTGFKDLVECEDCGGNGECSACDGSGLVDSS